MHICCIHDRFRPRRGKAFHLKLIRVDAESRYEQVFSNDRHRSICVAKRACERFDVRKILGGQLLDGFTCEAQMPHVVELRCAMIVIDRNVQEDVAQRRADGQMDWRQNPWLYTNHPSYHIRFGRNPWEMQNPWGAKRKLLELYDLCSVSLSGIPASTQIQDKVVASEHFGPLNPELPAHSKDIEDPCVKMVKSVAGNRTGESKEMFEHLEAEFRWEFWDWARRRLFLHRGRG